MKTASLDSEVLTDVLLKIRASEASKMITYVQTE
jgi:hypothetical protein